MREPLQGIYKATERISGMEQKKDEKYLPGKSCHRVNETNGQILP